MTERTKAELLSELRSSAEEILGKLEALTEEQLTTGRYESGWNGRQILAHTAAMEWTYPRLIDLAARDGGAKPQKVDSSSSRGEASGKSSSFSIGVDDYNQRQVEKRAGASVRELISEFKANREALIGAVEAADEGLFGREIQSAGGIKGTLANVIYALAVGHSGSHVSDILGSS